MVKKVSYLYFCTNRMLIFPIFRNSTNRNDTSERTMVYGDVLNVLNIVTDKNLSNVVLTYKWNGGSIMLNDRKLLHFPKVHGMNK